MDKTSRTDEQISEELLGVKVYFDDGLVSGLESTDGKRVSVNYARKNNGRVKYQDGAPIVDEVIFVDGFKLKRDPETRAYLDPRGYEIYASPVVHAPSMGDNQAFIRYRDVIGNPHTIFASRGDVLGPSLPIDSGLLIDLWHKNLTRLSNDDTKKVNLADLVRAVENPAITGMDAVFVATLKKRYDLIASFDKNPCISETDIVKLDRAFQSFRPGQIGGLTGKRNDLDTIINSWVSFQNKAKFVTSKLYLHGPTESIRPEYVLQGDTGNCYWQSSLMAIAKVNPKLVEGMIKRDREGNWRVLFPQKRFYYDYVTVKPLTETEQLLYSGAAGGGQWSGVLEKAAAQYIGKHADHFHKKAKTQRETWQDYSESGVQTGMLNLLTDKVCTVESPNTTSLERLHQLLTDSQAQHLPMGAGINKPTVKGLYGNHNYAILNYDSENRIVTFYDPNHYIEPRDQKGRDRDGVKNGIFTMSLKEFQHCCDEFNFLENKIDEVGSYVPPIGKNLFDDQNIVKTDGQVVLATQDEAIELCKKMGGHLPTARELAECMNPDGILEVDYVEKDLNGAVPDGYYKVECENDGVKDVFYFNNSKSRQLTGEVARLSFWTSSKVLGNSQYGHVFYGWLGGGRPSKDDHASSYKHAVLIVRPEKSEGKE